MKYTNIKLNTVVTYEYHGLMFKSTYKGRNRHKNKWYYQFQSDPNVCYHLNVKDVQLIAYTPQSKVV